MLMNACCCDPTCIIFKDDFDRGNSSDIGSNWTETGTVEISSNQLRMTGSGTAITTMSHTSELMVVRVVLSIGSGTIGTKSSDIIVNYKDSSNYHFVRIDGVYSGLATPIRTDLKFYKRSAGVDTQLGSTRVLDAANVITSIDITVCFDGTYLSAAGFREATTKIVDGFKAGLSATAAATAINWNAFYWYRSDPRCPTCVTLARCGDCRDQLPASLILDLGAGGLVDNICTNCDDIKGLYVLDFSGGPSCQWVYSKNLCGTPATCVFNISLHIYIISGLAGVRTYHADLELSRPTGIACGLGIGRALLVQYTSAGFLETDCDNFPVALNRVTFNFTDDPFGVNPCDSGASSMPLAATIYAP